MKKTSYINGSAVVVFGGGIAVQSGYSVNKKEAVVAFSELKKQLECGEDFEEDAPKYPIQVQLVFDNLKSIEVVRRALDTAERFLKNEDTERDGQ